MSSRNWRYLIYLSISGLAVGWIVGLSMSPVLHILLGSLLALIVSVISAIAGLEKADRPEAPKTADNSQSLTHKISRIQIDPRPITCFVIGLAIGSSVGVYARANDWLSANPRVLVERWKGNGLDEAEIRRRLFNEIYGVSSVAGEASKNRQASPSRGGLFAIGVSDCDNLRLKHGAALRAELAILNDSRINKFLTISSDSLSLEALKEFLCGQND